MPGNIKSAIIKSAVLIACLVAILVLLPAMHKYNENTEKIEIERIQKLLDIGTCRYGTIVSIDKVDTIGTYKVFGFRIVHSDGTYEDVKPILVDKPTLYKIGDKVYIYSTSKLTILPKYWQTIYGVDSIIGDYFSTLDIVEIDD